MIKKLPDKISLKNIKKIIEEQKKTPLKKEDLIMLLKILMRKKKEKCCSKELFHALTVIGEKLTENDIENI